MVETVDQPLTSSASNATANGRESIVGDRVIGFPCPGRFKSLLLTSFLLRDLGRAKRSHRD
jgi:hypothetical protein